MTNQSLVGSPFGPILHTTLRTGVAALLVAALALPAPTARAQERVMPDSMPERPRVPIFDPGQPMLEKTLKNGVRLLVQEQRTGPGVAGVAALRMGARYEKDDGAGLGELLARTMITGTSRSSASDFVVRVQGNNATFDASVGSDVAQLSILSDREHVEGAAALLADVVLAPALADTSFDAARIRAINEATAASQSPLPSAFAEFLAVFYAGTPYHRASKDLVPVLAESRRSDIAALHKRVAVGGNITVLFVGNFDGKKVMAQLEKAFAAAPAGPAMPPAGPEPQPLASDTLIVLERPWVANACVVGYPAPGYADPDFPAFLIIDSYLRAEDRSPILFWMPTRGDAVTPGVVYTTPPTRGSIAVYFGSTKERTAAARDTVVAVVQRLRTEALERGDWSVHLRRVQNGFFHKQEDPMVRAKMISRYAAQGLPLDYPQQLEAKLLKLTPEDVRAAADRWLLHSCQVILGPASANSGDAKP
jgi:zinc protease